jgi:hypothetical protein
MGLVTRMFRVILGFGGERRGIGNNWQRYSHEIHELFAELYHGVAEMSHPVASIVP